MACMGCFITASAEAPELPGVQLCHVFIVAQEGFTNLWNWFDEHTWYPLGRVIGGTVYPVRT